MDIQTLKIELAQKILSSNRPDILEKIVQLLKTENQDDWWKELPKEVQDSINQGLLDAEKGNVLDHEQVVQEAREKYGF